MVTTYAPLTINRDLDAGLTRLLAGGESPDVARSTLGALLQSALRLEFATIPPYLAAAYSLLPGNERIRDLLLRISREEMLHLTVVANLMNAIGVPPDIVGIVPVYPCRLDVLDPPLILNLKSFSVSLVKEELMRIEAPEEPVDFPEPRFFTAPVAAGKPRTIGQFYAAIIGIIASDKIPGLFDDAKRDAYKQIAVHMNTPPFAYVNNTSVQTYPLTPTQDMDFVIDDKLSALRHLEWIVDQGEGSTPLNPLTAEGIPGHYYRLESIVKARYLIPDETEPVLGHSFSGADLFFDTNAVHRFDDNAKLENYVSNVRTSRYMKRFNEGYTEMINGLQKAFNCPSPEHQKEAAEAYEAAKTSMNDMRTAAAYLLPAARAEGVGAGLPFEYG